MISQDRTLAFLLGSYIADAAALGLHWIYDTDKIKARIQSSDLDTLGKSPAFLSPAPEHFHGMKKAGDLTHYGEATRVLHQSLLRTKGTLDCDDYQRGFAKHFGAGGHYRGYIDHPTRLTLQNLAQDIKHPSGADDDQNPAASKLAPLVVAYANHATDYRQEIEEAVRVTNNNDTAVHYALITAEVLIEALRTGNLSSAIEAGQEVADNKANALIKEALENDTRDSTTMAKHFGQACHLHQSIPTAIHIMANADSFQSANEINILAGGDSAGRAPFIGAVMGAIYGLGTRKGIPLNWLAKMNDLDNLVRECEELTALSNK